MGRQPWLTLVTVNGGLSGSQNSRPKLNTLTQIGYSPESLGLLLFVRYACCYTCLLCYFFGLGHGGMVRASITHADQHRQGRGGVGAQWTEKVPHSLLHLSTKLARFVLTCTCVAQSNCISYW